MGKMEEINNYYENVINLKNQLQRAQNKEELEKIKEELEMILKNISEVFEDNDHEIEKELKELKNFINKSINEVKKKINFLNYLEGNEEIEYLKERYFYDKFFKEKANVLHEKLHQKLMKERKKSKIKIIVMVTYIFLIVIFSPLLLIEDKGIEKIKIQESIKTILKNKGDLEILKSTLSTFPTVRITFLSIIKRKIEVYHESVPIEKILIDMRNNNYKSENFDTQLNEKITLLLKENGKTSPIDKVTKNQAEYFLNIKGKLDEENYNKIENDLIKIIEDMSYNNELINVYLAQADKSYLFSIIALIISAISVPVVVIQLVEAVRNYFNTRKMKKEEKIKEKTNKKEE